MTMTTMATIQKASGAGIKDIPISIPITPNISQEIDLNFQPTSSNTDSTHQRTRQESHHGFNLDCSSNDESNCRFHTLDTSDIEENYTQPISNLHASPEISTAICLASSLKPTKDDEPILRGRTRTRAGSVSSTYENLFGSCSRVSSTDTDSVTERSDSVFSPPKSKHGQRSREHSPHAINHSSLPKQKPRWHVNEDVSSKNLVPCLQCLHSGLRCSFSLRRIQDRSCCTRCRRIGNQICIARVYTGMDGNGEKKYAFATDFEKVQEEAFEEMLNKLQQEKWLKDRFALPKLQPGYKGRLNNWRETSVERWQRTKDCRFVVT